jgi:hypothetical protein
MMIVLLRPYKDAIVNNFTILNEAILFVIGCYLFIFLSDETSAGNIVFYSWLVIALVVIMITFNMLFLIPFKTREAFFDYKEKKRIDRLKIISEVEQKYLFFDYKKFFLSTLHLYQNKMPAEVKDKKKDKGTLKPTEIYDPSSEESIEESVVESINDSRDNPPPEAYNFDDNSR